MFKHLMLTLAMAASTIATPSTSSLAGESRGAGSTFVSPVMDKWIAAYAAATGNRIQYQAVGSGIGINLIKKAEVDFGASDRPLPPAELSRLGLVQFPLVIGGVVPVVNIAGILPGQLKFTGPLLADIYLGKVKTWDDPAIRSLNTDLQLPHLPITVVHRLDGSGTTFNWSNYLSKVSSEWKATIGEGTTVDWPRGMGGKGNDGVASLVALVPGAIGYLEYSYALQKFDRISFGIVQNRAGQFVSPATETFQAAASSADWKATRDFFLILTDAPGDNAYPITATTFVLMYRQPKSQTNAAVTLDFLKWSLDNGSAHAAALNYVPLPSALVRQVQAYWDANVMRMEGPEVAKRN